MNNSFFFLQAEETEKNNKLINDVKTRSESNKTQVFVIDRPLGDNKYYYKHRGAIVVLILKKKISCIDFSNDNNSFMDSITHFIEDLGSLSDKFRYKNEIGRPRNWREKLLSVHDDGSPLALE